MSCENSQSHLECVETNQKFFHTIIQKSHRIKNIAITEYKGSSYFVTAENVFILFVTETNLLLLNIYIVPFFVRYTL